MITYLIYSTGCMGLVLLFYHAVLAGEKIYQINRWYLLAGLLFSLVVPFVPMGMAGSILPLGGSTGIPPFVSNNIDNTSSESIRQVVTNSTGGDHGAHTSNVLWSYGYSLFLFLYSIVTIFLVIRMARHLYRMQRKTMKNPTTHFKGHKVVLLDEDMVPHTFWKTIFVNKKQYEKGKISDDVLIHELTHARENHSLDILFVEILKTIYWFNPVLYPYKKAIQLNHEYIADDHVLSNGTDIADYQRLLLRTHTTKSVHYLSTSLNFNITKKRFKMMTLKNSTFRSYLKAALIIPFLLILGITFGCEPASMEEDNQPEFINVELVDAETIKLNGQTVSASNFESEFSDLPIDPEKVIIDLKVHLDASFGLVTDVQQVLRKHGALRINYSSIKSSGSQSEDVQSTTLDRRNVLDLYINKEGNILANQERTPLSSVERLVKEFITNNGESASLSENPKTAIIAIKTDRSTPYDIYSSILKRIIGVYDELRNQASIQLFDKPFNSLEEGGKERNKIENMYPKRISIKEPSNG